MSQVNSLIRGSYCLLLNPYSVESMMFKVLLMETRTLQLGRSIVVFSLNLK